MMTPVKRKLQVGEVLFKEGDLATSFYVILAGVISLGNERSGKMIEKSRLTTNATVGDLFFNQPKQSHRQTAKAVSETEILEFPFDQIQVDIKTLPAWTQLMLKTYGDRLLEAEKELRGYRGEEAIGISADDVMRTISGLRLAFSSLELEDGKLPWEKTREYLLQVMQLPALRAVPVLKAMASTGWIKLEESGDDLQFLFSPELEKFNELEGFIRQYRGSRTKRSMIEMTPTDVLALSALCEAAQGKADAHRGAAKVDLSAALAIAQKMPGGGSFRVEHFDLLQVRGLDFIKESAEGGLRASFNLSEFEKIRSFWRILSSALAST